MPRCLSVLEDIEYFLQKTAPKLLVVCGDMCRTMNEACGAAGVTGPPPAHPPNVVRLFSTQVRMSAHSGTSRSCAMRVTAFCRAEHCSPGW